MPVLDIRAISEDVSAIDRISSGALETILDNTHGLKAGELTEPVLLITKNLRHLYAVINVNPSAIEVFAEVPDRLPEGFDVVRFKAVLIQISTLCDKISSRFSNRYDSGSTIASDTVVDIHELTSNVNKLVDLLEGRKVEMLQVERNLDVDVVDGGDISIGDVFLAYDGRSGEFRMGVCHSIVHSALGDSISVEDDGSDAIAIDRAVFLRPEDHIPKDMLGILDTIGKIHSLECAEEGRGLAQSTEKVILKFLMGFIDGDHLNEVIEYRKKFL